MSEVRTILVTGCTSGIGLAVAHYLHEQGYQLLLVGRSEEKLQKISSETAGSPYVVCDLKDSTQIKNIFSYCQDTGKKLNGMVHCAGMGAEMPIRSLREEDMESLVRVHYYAFLMLCKYFYSRKVSEDRASIVAVSSISTMTKRKGSVLYASSKSALNTAVEVASKEFLRRSIRVNAILPAYVDTPMIDNLEEIMDINKVQPMGLIPARSIAEIVEFLLTDKSRYITGALIPISAGMEI